MKTPLVFLVRFYQNILSPDQGMLRALYPFRGACIMYPSCSAYLLLAIKKHGAIKGVCLGAFRIGRCHPFQKRLIDLP